jgi:hypothetical protein
VWTSDRTTRCASLGDRLERAAAAVDGGRAADGDDHLAGARGDGCADQYAGPVGGGAPRIEFVGVQKREAARRGGFHERSLAVLAE